MRQLTSLIVSAVAALCLVGGAQAQSVSPMRAKGLTPTLVKGFHVKIGNPYKVPMTFVVTAMDPKFVHPAGGTEVQPASIRLAPGYSRSVLVAFKIDPPHKERTIGLCVSPDHLAGPVLPRVCGSYTGVLLPGNGR